MSRALLKAVRSSSRLSPLIEGVKQLPPPADQPEDVRKLDSYVTFELNGPLAAIGFHQDQISDYLLVPRGIDIFTISPAEEGEPFVSNDAAWVFLQRADDREWLGVYGFAHNPRPVTSERKKRLQQQARDHFDLNNQTIYIRTTDP